MGSAGAVKTYFTKSDDWQSPQGRCMPVSWQTPYMVSARDDYKRCVCYYWGEGEEDCPTADDDDNQQSEDENEDQDSEEQESESEEEEEESDEDGYDPYDPKWRTW